MAEFFSDFNSPSFAQFSRAFSTTLKLWVRSFFWVGLSSSGATTSSKHWTLQFRQFARETLMKLSFRLINSVISLEKSSQKNIKILSTIKVNRRAIITTTQNWKDFSASSEEKVFHISRKYINFKFSNQINFHCLKVEWDFLSMESARK